MQGCYISAARREAQEGGGRRRATIPRRESLIPKPEEPRRVRHGETDSVLYRMLEVDTSPDFGLPIDVLGGAGGIKLRLKISPAPGYACSLFSTTSDRHRKRKPDSVVNYTSVYAFSSRKSILKAATGTRTVAVR